MKTTLSKTFTAMIYVGFKERKTDEIRDIKLARKVCQTYCNDVGWCVTLTPTDFIYTNGSEPGCIVGLINYPRFPVSDNVLSQHAITLANLLKKEYKQCRVSVVMPTETVMLSGDPEVDEKC